ncbi:MAG: hypothetical protein HY304_01945, partial [candidate division Zixibacteria bacterium]|nr:hypothetical protein [candidate division Zixibacteria bacterium]
MIAIRDLNNGKTPRSEASTHPDGVVATLNFGAALNTDARGKCSRLDFYSANCQHNLLSADSSRIRYAPDPGVGELILDQYYDTTSCTQLGLSMIPAIAYTSGTVCIRTDSPPAVTGDINLDGAGPDVGDVVGFINYYFRRLPLGSPTDPTLRALLVAACDVNGDGHPLTLADFENLFRIAFRGFDPVPPLPPYVDTLFVDIQPESDGFRLNTHATIVVDGVYIEVEHPRQHDHFARWEGERSARTTGYEIGDVTGYVFEHFTNAGPGSINGPDPILDTAREAPIFLSSNPRGGIRILSV